MKKLSIIFAVMLIAFTVNNLEAKRAVCYEDSPGNGNFDWNGERTSCPIGGHFCTKTVTETSPKEVDLEYSAPLGGVFITSTFEGITFNVTADPQYGTFTSIHDGKNYTFGENEKIFIVNSDDYPSLNNLSVSLEGITTDSNGEYTVFVPLP